MPASLNGPFHRTPTPSVPSGSASAFAGPADLTVETVVPRGTPLRVATGNGGCLELESQADHTHCRYESVVRGKRWTGTATCGQPLAIKNPLSGALSLRAAARRPTKASAPPCCEASVARRALQALDRCVPAEAQAVRATSDIAEDGYDNERICVSGHARLLGIAFGFNLCTGAAQPAERAGEGSSPNEGPATADRSRPSRPNAQPGTPTPPSASAHRGVVRHSAFWRRSAVGTLLVPVPQALAEACSANTAP